MQLFYTSTDLLHYKYWFIAISFDTILMHSDYKYETVISRMLGGPVGPSHRGRQLTSYPSEPPAAAP